MILWFCYLGSFLIEYCYQTCSQLKSRIYRNASFEDVSFGIVAFSSLECNQKDMRIPTVKKKSHIPDN